MSHNYRTKLALLASIGLIACSPSSVAEQNSVISTANVGAAIEDGTEVVATMSASITKADVVAAQMEWGNGIVAIAKTHTDGGDYSKRATEHINTLYSYGLSPVMFKPTLASEDQYRETFEEALSYFIGAEGTEDSGFAIKGWTNVRWENNGIYVGSDSAMAMGNYFFTGPDGGETKVEYTFGYVLDEDGNLKINLHHSSLPYSPA